LAGALLAITFAGSVFQSDLIGWWRGEAKYKGRYTNFWRAELRQLDGERQSVYFLLLNCRQQKSAWWEKLRDKLLPGRANSRTPDVIPLLEDDPEAIPVLIELLRAPERAVRIRTIELLELKGLAALDAVEALEEIERSEDRELSHRASRAIKRIDPGWLDASSIANEPIQGFK
jgi:hypothetical protein